MRDFLDFAKSVAEDGESEKGGGNSDRSRAEYVRLSRECVPADVRMISGCGDTQTSMDSNVANFELPLTSGPSGAAGACTTSLLQALNQNPNLSWVALLDEMRKILKQRGYKQVPELSTSQDFDVRDKVNFLNPKGGSRGRKKALLVGINYKGQKGQLNGCINDVKRVYNYLTECHGYQKNEIRILTDETREKPTARNIMQGLRWLSKGAGPCDSLFFHYSGHGGRIEDDDGDELDGYDETLVPLDFKTAGHIRDDDIFRTLVAPLPKGTTLRCVVDACHSGTVLDLPFMLSGTDENMEAYEAGAPITLMPNEEFNMEAVLAIAKDLYKVYKESGGDMKLVSKRFFSTVAAGQLGDGGGDHDEFDSGDDEYGEEEEEEYDDEDDDDDAYEDSYEGERKRDKLKRMGKKIAGKEEDSGAGSSHSSGRKRDKFKRFGRK